MQTATMVSGWWFLLGVLCFSTLVTPAVQEIKEEYRLRRPTHTACRAPNKNCKIAKSGVSPSDRLLILKTHNDFRSMVALGKLKGFPPAADMRKLEWDAELASVAQVSRGHGVKNKHGLVVQRTPSH
ncbi:hypothetical protein HPB51_006280 [Rhipicephalus microplus]|uniref:Uncharacterized protein n=1 Tax=Rhipicephalus microplus TaxID=6941 RepID=A0A9J6EMZ5_RHIMP|nr:hypothetical protein HPB51_006280 [Rhipicephalus microplus]